MIEEKINPKIETVTIDLSETFEDKLVNIAGAGVGVVDSSHAYVYIKFDSKDAPEIPAMPLAKVMMPFKQLYITNKLAFPFGQLKLWIFKEPYPFDINTNYQTISEGLPVLTTLSAGAVTHSNRYKKLIIPTNTTSTIMFTFQDQAYILEPVIHSVIVREVSDAQWRIRFYTIPSYTDHMIGNVYHITDWIYSSTLTNGTELKFSAYLFELEITTAGTTSIDLDIFGFYPYPAYINRLIGEGR